MNKGFENENKIFTALNGKHFNELNRNLQNLIISSFNNQNGTIVCIKEGGNKKSDIKIKINREEHTFSIKIGSGNSVHQEHVESFVEYLEKNFKLDKSTKKDILLFIWGDGTVTGKGKKENRISASEFIKKYPEKIKNIQELFNKSKRKLIKRFLIQGVNNSKSIDFIYYGDDKNGICKSSKNVLKYIIENESNGAISIGKLTFQAWNRNINGGIASENKRGVIQLKWGTMKQDIMDIKDE